MVKPMAMRLAASLLALTLGLAGCGQGGNPEVANQAADDFMTALVRRDVTEAWSHLHPDTQHVVYADDKAAFARDVNGANWSQLR